MLQSLERYWKNNKKENKEKEDEETNNGKQDVEQIQNV